MPEDSGFLVEEFIQSITAQLDRVQDVLRLKALTRPLTYALKDFALDLNVFVDMDSEGNVRFRTSGPNESGASVVRLGFTTITKPMIDENTVSLALTKSPTLDELGLESEERRRLGQLGIRNAAQLEQLHQSTGASTISRYTGVSVKRLRQAMRLSQPFIKEVTPEKQPPSPPVSPVVQQPPVKQPPIKQPAIERSPLTRQPFQKTPVVKEPSLSPTGPSIITKPTIRVSPDTQRLRLNGGNLMNSIGTPNVSLAGQSLSVDVLDDDEMVVELPAQHQGGILEIELPHGNTLSYDLRVDDRPYPGNGNHADKGSAEDMEQTELTDPWSPDGGAE